MRRATLIFAVFVLSACASAPKTHHTAPTRAPSLTPITRDIRDAKASVGRAFKSSVRVEDFRSRIEFKATRILERWELKRKPKP